MDITEKLLTKNKYSRPCTPIGKIKKIVIHWVGNAGSSAIANRNYFEGLKDGANKVYASSHYIIGLEGEIIQCIPEDEVAYHGNSSNGYSIGIENCHPDWAGKFNNKTYKSLVELCADLCKRYGLNPLTDMIRHYDVTGKMCPLYYVKNTNAWQQLKQDVKKAINNENKDEELEKASAKLKSKGIISNIDMWSSINAMDMKYVPALISKMGGLEKLIQANIISDRTIWENKQYKTKHVRSLIVKYASKC